MSFPFFLRSFPPASLVLFSVARARLSIPRPALLFNCPSPRPIQAGEYTPPPTPSLLHHERTKERVSDTTLQIPFTPQPPPPFQMGLPYSFFFSFFFSGSLWTPRVLQNGCGPLPSPLLSCPSSTCSLATRPMFKTRLPSLIPSTLLRL